MRYDIIIIGGGMVGATLAYALADTHLKIALIDASPLTIQDDPRLIALNYRSVNLFQTLNLWPAMSPHAASIQQVHISNRGHFGVTRLNASDIDLPALGYVVPAKYITAAVNKPIPNVTVLRPATLKKIFPTESEVTLEVQTSEKLLTLTATHIIAADGTHSSVREQLAIPTKTTDFHQSALVTITQIQRSHQNIAYERFHASGAIAMLPLPENRVATIWTDQHEIIQQLSALNDEAFLQTLQKHFGYRNGRLLAVDKRHTYPLTSITAEKTQFKNVILIGNAAHTLHPVAAQGLNLALAEITTLTEIIKENPATPNWKIFLTTQQKRQTTSQQLSHDLPKFFASDFLPIQLSRQAGLISLDIFPNLKRRFIARALG
jgi:2-octaprenyl-6-methoxyphenol hydroxylase